MKIYGERLSRTERVLWAADECGVQYDHIPVPVNGARSEALLAINPDGAIPTLDDDGVVLTQS
jgi:glutathione S-transferase